MSLSATIRAVSSADEPEWRRLWAGYLAFYEAAVPERVTAATWRDILDPASGLIGRIAGDGRPLLGFSVSVIHRATWTDKPVCYLEDLFVDPAARGQGIGRALIEDLIALARSSGWARLYWHTRAGNLPARRLYDSFTPADDFVRYRLFLE